MRKFPKAYLLVYVLRLLGSPLKMKIKYIYGGCIYEWFIDYENITNRCYGCGSQTINLMHVYKILKVWLLGEKVQESSQVDEFPGFNVEGKKVSQEADCIEVKQKHKQRSSKNKINLLSKWIKVEMQIKSKVVVDSMVSLTNFWMKFSPEKTLLENLLEIKDS